MSNSRQMSLCFERSLAELMRMGIAAPDPMSQESLFTTWPNQRVFSERGACVQMPCIRVLQCPPLISEHCPEAKTGET